MITLFLCGDVMTGRGIDQVLPHPSQPQLHEDYVTSAVEYVELAELANGPIPAPVDFAYIWGDALTVLDRVQPDVRIINLETSVTVSEEWRRKGINYRMSPANIPCITAAQIDCCVLANNHVMDWGHEGLVETLDTLKRAGLKAAGAGRDVHEAEASAILDVPAKGRVLVFAFGTATSGVPRSWAAREDRAGVDQLADLSAETAAEIAKRIKSEKRECDIVVASIHWGSNWGYEVSDAERIFAHSLIDDAGVDIVHGHSSHHPRGIEVYKEKPILYGCGDFINDYEGIRGYEHYRDDLVLMYLPTLDPSSGALVRMQLIPFQIRKFRLQTASHKDSRWLADLLNREGKRLGTSVTLTDDDTLLLHWN